VCSEFVVPGSVAVYGSGSSVPDRFDGFVEFVG
jgi:hypothetical protein